MASEKAGAVHSRTPTRICDLGGWTDTWFSGRGNVLSIAVGPGVRCRVSLASSGPPRSASLTLDVTDFDERYSFDPGNPPLEKHPLLEATVAEIGIPPETAAEVSIRSFIPPGAGTGTSAAASVALIGALDLLTPGRLDRDSIWKTAHRVETEILGWESGVQDQISATFGGVSLISIDEYPDADRSGLDPGRKILDRLEERMILVYLGSGHMSTDIHRDVISRLSEGGSESAALTALREMPLMARDALEEGDLVRFGQLMIQNTEAQRSLHPALVSADADRVIELAREHGAHGWKVNGAGGEGGSLAILSGDRPGSRQAILEAIETLGGGIRYIPVEIDYDGLTVERTEVP